MGSQFISSNQPRAKWMRLDTAHLLKRFFFCERALVVAQAAWIPLVAPLEIKIGMARSIWQCAETANALRERVFELRFPSRLLEEEGLDGNLVALFSHVKNSPSPAAFLAVMSRVLLPAMCDFYREYLASSDPIADGPTHRFLSLAVSEKQQQISSFKQWADSELARSQESRNVASEWTGIFGKCLQEIAEVGVEKAAESSRLALPAGSEYKIPHRPARDPRFFPCRFYWPDIVDRNYPYGEGLQLQLRSAISHVNEVWAIEAGGVMLSSFSEVLPWEWIRDSARWTYDESRHCQMGYERLRAWGFDLSEIPLGTYIYDSASGQDPIYRLGMLYFFETKNIKHKLTRAQRFHEYGDGLSEHDMDFDWADETIHAGYGKHWLKELLAARGEDPAAYDAIRERCGQLVSEYVSTATVEEIATIKRVAADLVAKASAACSKDSFTTLSSS